MHKLTVCSTLVLVTFLVSACDDAKSNVAAPTLFDAAGVSADVTAGSPIATFDRDRSCRAFTVPLELSLRAGTLDVSITSVTMRFVNSSGVPITQVTLPAPNPPAPFGTDVSVTPPRPAPMPQVTLPAPIPTAQVGSDLIAARSVRTIAFFAPIGCTVDPTGTVIVVVGTQDGRGRRNSVEVRARVQ
jgi:hypothetical protein